MSELGTNINENLAGILPETENKPCGNCDNSHLSAHILNAVENAILKYGRKHRDLISNPYQHFSELLGYKSKNHVYSWFQLRDHSKIGLNDLRTILSITKDARLLTEIINDFKQVVK